MQTKNIAIIGSGPSGLMAAEVLSAQGLPVTVYERKPSVGRKFLMAGRGGLNLTHSENLDTFIARYENRADILDPLIRAFPPQALRDWCEGLGEPTFVGSSGRVFPQSFKASPLLRAWIARLEKQNVRFAVNHDWQGWQNDALVFQTPDGTDLVKADATLLALGGASWPRLGTDGSWTGILEKHGVDIAPLQPANCGFTVDWSDIFAGKFAGQPLKPVAASFGGTTVHADIMISARGVEGGAIYALSSKLRDTLQNTRDTHLILDLKPDLNVAEIADRLDQARGRESLSNHLRRTLKLSPVAIGLLMEVPNRHELGNYASRKLASLIKHYPLALKTPFAIDRAISTAGGVSFDALDHHLMLHSVPNVFVSGEMLDWEAPTGGYLLQACMATGVHAARGIIERLTAA